MSEPGYISPKDFYEYMNKEHPGLIGINKIYSMCKKRTFPCMKLGGRYVILKKEAEQWLVNQSKRYFK